MIGLNQGARFDHDKGLDTLEASGSSAKRFIPPPTIYCRGTHKPKKTLETNSWRGRRNGNGSAGPDLVMAGERDLLLVEDGDVEVQRAALCRAAAPVPLAYIIISITSHNLVGILASMLHFSKQFMT